MQFDGRLWSGPFSKLFEIFEQIGWSLIDPPWVQDHDFCTWKLLDLPQSLLHMLLEDASVQRLAFEVSHRRDYSGLVGVTWPPSTHETRLTAQDVASVNSIREGAVYVGSKQGKFDLKKGTACAFCQQPDTIKHRCADCPALSSARAQHGSILARWEQLPVALTEPLLPSRNPHFVRRKQALIAIPDVVSCYCFSPQVTFQGTWVDFFTDGSCWDPNLPQVSLAAWAAVSATHACVLSSGPLSGFKQDINRAELTAALSVVCWTLDFRACSTLWTDSSYVGMGIANLLQDPLLCDFDSNEDLWEQVAARLHALPPGSFRVQHIKLHQISWSFAFWGAATVSSSPQWPQLIQHQTTSLTVLARLETTLPGRRWLRGWRVGNALPRLDPSRCIYDTLQMWNAKNVLRGAKKDEDSEWIDVSQNLDCKRMLRY